MTKKVGMISLGCPKNLVDSENMLAVLQAENFAITADPDDADIMVINTCAFIEDAKKESVDTILEMAELKKKGKLKKLIVAGCLAQRYQNELQDELPEVDHFIGTGEFHRVAQIASHALPVRTLVGKPTFVYDYAVPKTHVLPKHTAYVKIAEGCSRTCSFCIIPKLRGPAQSRPIASVVREVQALVAGGAKEINLIAQDLTAYGRDRQDGASLVDLLRQLREVPRLVWLRLMYNYPMYFSEELIDVIAQSDNICKYLDMPLQHIDSSLLASMRRKVDEKETLSLLDKLRERITGLVLRTTLIVGFPGETDSQFEKLRQFVESQQFDRLGVFTYSQEEGTGAARMSAQVPDEVKHQRKHILMSLQQGICQKKQRDYHGQAMPVLIDRLWNENPDYLAVGRTMGQALDIDGCVYIRQPLANSQLQSKQKIKSGVELQAGQLVDVTVNDSTAYDLMATVNAA